MCPACVLAAVLVGKELWDNKDIAFKSSEKDKKEVKDKK